jgi:hypothetical protein
MAPLRSAEENEYSDFRAWKNAILALLRQNDSGPPQCEKPETLLAVNSKGKRNLGI